MKKKFWIRKLFLWGPIIILMIFSLINMYYAKRLGNSFNNYFIKQSLWFGLGLLIFLIIKKIDLKIFFKFSKYLYFFNVLLLILVLFFGVTINGAKAWFNFKFFSFQPSELMKFSLALYLCQYLSNFNKHSFKNELKFILTTLFITAIPSLFVFLEPDTGAIIIYLMIMLGCILAFKINFKWYLLLGSILLIFLGGFYYLYYCNKDLLINLIGTSFFYRIDRLLTFVNNDSFQLNRALISIGSSTFWWGNYVYIPEAPTDFIIAFSISNLGIFSFIIIIFCFLILNIYFLRKFFKLKSLKFKMFLASFILMFLYAQIQNIGMNLGLLPIIGLPLPFLSYGGTNIIVYFLFLALIDKMN